jgi:threonine dehydratase
MTRSIAYPAANHEQAKARARADADENGWSVVESDWHPHVVGGGGVLVVHVSEDPPSRTGSDAPRNPRIRGQQ